MQIEMKLPFIDKAKKVTFYSDAIIRRYHNKRVILVYDKKSDGFVLESVTCGENIGSEIAVSRIEINKNIRADSIALSRETLEAFILSGIQLLDKLNSKK